MDFKSIIESNSIDIYNYLKHDACKKSSRITGKALELNKCDNIVVIDVDIKHNLSNETKQEIRESFIKVLINFNSVIVVKTGNGGLHIYTKRDNYECGNRSTKQFKSDDYDIDLFNSDVNKDKRSLIVIPPSKVRNDNKKIVQYEFILGNENTIIDTPTKTVLDALIDADLIQDEELNKRLISLLNDIERNKDKFNNLDDDAADFMDDDNISVNNEILESNSYHNERLILEGFKGITIHNDAGHRSIQEEITLLTLFQALNALPEPLINYAYDYIKHNAKLTSSALDKWDSAKTRHMGKKTTSYVLVKMLKIHNQKYYNEVLKPIYDKPIESKLMSRSDCFTWSELVKNCENDVYNSPNEAVSDMTRLMRICDNTNIFWIVKDSDNLFKIVSDETQHKKLFRVKCCGSNLWNIYNENSNLFRINGIKFNTNESGYFNVFQGFKYHGFENVGLANKWKEFVKQIICNNREDLYQYVQHWVSYIIRNPGLKTGTALIMKGLQGIGKGTFSQVLCKLFDGYVAPNITDMNELTGSFNTAIDGKILCFCNELKNVGEERLANFDCLKSIITEYDIRYNEKGIPRRDGENNANFIFMTNNAYPVKIEIDDRRYIVFEVNPSKRGDTEYWNNLYSLIENDEFIEAVMFDYLNNYNDEFDLRKCISTQERDDLIEAGKNDLIDMIESHYKAFVAGTMLYDTWRPVGMKPRTLGIQLKKYCDSYKSKARDETRDKMIYKLKPEWKDLLNDNEPNDDDNDDIDLDAI